MYVNVAGVGAQAAADSRLERLERDEMRGIRNCWPDLP
jgi:hypothetical protein